MKKLFEKAKQIARTAEAKCAGAASIGCTALMIAASAEDTTAATITTAFQTGFQQMASDALGMIAVIVPIALGVAGAVFLVRKAMAWFKSLAK